MFVYRCQVNIFICSCFEVQLIFQFCVSFLLGIKTEAATGGVLLEKAFLKISQNSQKNTYARDSFLIKLRFKI